jgi:hypothetical protein
LVKISKDKIFIAWIIVTIRRTDLRTAKIVNLVCKLCDESGDFVTSLTVLAKHVPASVADRVLFFPENRRTMPELAGPGGSTMGPALMPFK